jgi:hypothetical protein
MNGDKPIKGNLRFIKHEGLEEIQFCSPTIRGFDGIKPEMFYFRKQLPYEPLTHGYRTTVIMNRKRDGDGWQADGEVIVEWVERDHSWRDGFSLNGKLVDRNYELRQGSWYEALGNFQAASLDDLRKEVLREARGAFEKEFYTRSGLRRTA